MTNTESLADTLVDRRLLRRKLTFWRVATVVVLVVLVLALGWRLGAAHNGGPLARNQIARIAIGGLITGDRRTLDALDALSRDSAVKAVILSIESPGGTTTGAERLYDALRKLAAAKPVVADVQGMAASGAYIAALGADHIVAQGNSLVGSIGVLIDIPNVSKLLGTIGVTMDEIKSTPLKAAPDGLTPTSPEATAAMQSVVADSYTWFKDLVKSRRNMTDAQLVAVDDGRIFTGRQGLTLKLVDQLGEENVAVAWLEQQKGVPPGLPIRDWRPRGAGGFSLFGAASNLASALGLEPLATALHRAQELSDSGVLDGLTSIWQAEALN
jgi:protease IV